MEEIEIYYEERGMSDGKKDLYERCDYSIECFQISYQRYEIFYWMVEWWFTSENNKLQIENMVKMEKLKRKHSDLKVHNKKLTLVMLTDQSSLWKYVYFAKTWRLASNMRNEYKREETH